MKRKKTAAASAPEEMTPEVQAGILEEKPFSPRDAVQVCLFSVLLFLAMTVQTARMSVLLPVLALALSIGRGPLRRMRERFCVPVVGFLAFALLYGIAALRGDFGDYAVKEFYKFMASSSLALLLLTRFDRKHVRGLLWGVAAVCAAIGLLSVDASVDGTLFVCFNGVVESLGASFAKIMDAPAGTRVPGIYNDANVTASLFALGALCGLHLTVTGKRRWERLAASFLTGVNGMSFFLSMSRAAILCFGLTLLVYLAAVGRETRTRLFFLVVIHIFVTVALSVPGASAVSRESGPAVAVTLGTGVLVWLLYEFPGLWLVKRLEGRGKALAAAAGVLVLAAGVYMAAAFQITSPHIFQEGAPFIRSAQLSAGTYQIEASGSEGLEVTVVFKETEGSYVGLFAGSPEEAEFTLEAPGEVILRFQGEDGAVLESAGFSNGVDLPMDYPLLPEFVTSRVESVLRNGFRTDSSFTLRLQYDLDGWKLFKQAPLLGRGLGCTEGWLTSVQPYFYESLYLHNHVLQVMNEMGLVGLAAYLSLLLGSLWLLVRRLRETRRNGGDPLAAALLACWVMMVTHNLMEISFSIRGYQCTAYLLLLLPVLAYGPREASEGAADAAVRAAKWGGTAALACLLVYLGVFAAALESHRMVEREMAEFSTSSAREFMETTERWIRRDLFDREQNRLNYVGNAVLLNDTRYNGNMLRYVKALRDSGTYAACTGLAEYYYLPRGEWEEVFACSREAVAQEASTNDAWNQQIEFYRETLLPQVTEEDAGVYLDGVLALKEYLEEYSQGRQEEISLTEANQAFLLQAERARESGLTGTAILMYLSLTAG